MNISIGYLFAILFFLCAASVVPSSIPSDDGKMKVVCYFSHEAKYREQHYKYTGDYTYPDLCTHIVYYANVHFSTALDTDTLAVEIENFHIDAEFEILKRVVEHRLRGRNVLATLNGFKDSFGYKYGHLLSNVDFRRKFIASVVEFINMYHFNGLELDLEFPTPDENQYYVQLVKELSEAFKPNGWTLSSIVSANHTIIRSTYDVPQLAQHLDWFSLMTGSDLQTGQFYANHNLSIDSIKYFIQNGVPSRKLVMGITSYGQSFSARIPENQFYVPASVADLEKSITNKTGSLAFFEICDKTKKSAWTVVHKADRNVGSYIHKDNQWMSYNDVDSIRAKAEFIRQMNLGGAMFKSVDMDDYKNSCGCDKYPLLTTLDQELRGVGSTLVNNCT